MSLALSVSNIAELEQEISTQLKRSPRTSRAVVEQSIANRYNFRSWKQLINFVSHDNGEPQDFLDLACLKYFHDDGPARWQKAQEMLVAEPELQSKSIYHACACGSLEHVTSYLETEPTLVNTPGGPMDWEPLLYACFPIEPSWLVFGRGSEKIA